MVLLNSRIAVIANELAMCERQCVGVVNCREQGRPPRGLVLEAGKAETRTLGVVVVGQNPGLAGKDECELYLRHGFGYRQQMLAWESVQSVPYFTRLRNLTRALGVSGPTLWTDVVKCEGARPSLLAKLTCADDFLRRELGAAPQEWPVFAAGRVAYDMCHGMAGERPVLGVFHPQPESSTGA